MVQGWRKEKFATELKAGKHTMISDISSTIGGTDLGPTPHELLEAALAACTVMTVQMYADRKGWPLNGADVKVTVDKEGPESHIAREIVFKGELDSEQRARLLDIANKCPVHRLLTSKISISTIEKG